MSKGPGTTDFLRIPGAYVSASLSVSPQFAQTIASCFAIAGTAKDCRAQAAAYAAAGVTELALTFSGAHAAADMTTLAKAMYS